ncbi:MAG: hypothetical protein ACFB6S_12750 [Geminicoccaceae bacterium]
MTIEPDSNLNEWDLLARDETSEGVVSAAVLTATAFRLRDERGLIAALRQLVAAVDRLEIAHQDD